MKETYFEGEIEYLKHSVVVPEEMVKHLKAFFMKGWDHGEYVGYQKHCQDFLDKESELAKQFKEVS